MPWVSHHPTSSHLRTLELAARPYTHHSHIHSFHLLQTTLIVVQFITTLLFNTALFRLLFFRHILVMVMQVLLHHKHHTMHRHHQECIPPWLHHPMSSIHLLGIILLTQAFWSERLQVLVVRRQQHNSIIAIFVIFQPVRNGFNHHVSVFKSLF